MIISKKNNAKLSDSCFKVGRTHESKKKTFGKPGNQRPTHGPFFWPSLTHCASHKKQLHRVLQNVLCPKSAVVTTRNMRNQEMQNNKKETCSQPALETCCWLLLHILFFSLFWMIFWFWIWVENLSNKAKTGYWKFHSSLPRLLHDASSVVEAFSSLNNAWVLGKRWKAAETEFLIEVPEISI